jgi:hypothetical protein
MSQVAQNLEAFFDHEVGLASLDIGYKADPAAILFVDWIIESLPWRESNYFQRLRPTLRGDLAVLSVVAQILFVKGMAYLSVTER